MKKEMRYFLPICFLIFLMTVTSCSLREVPSVSQPQPNPQNGETDSNLSKETDFAEQEASDLSNKNLSDTEYEISFAEIPFSEDFPDLAFLPTLFEDKLMLTFALPLSDTQWNTMVYDLKMQTSTALPFYAPNRFYADENDYNCYENESGNTGVRNNLQFSKGLSAYLQSFVRRRFSGVGAGSL